MLVISMFDLLTKYIQIGKALIRNSMINVGEPYFAVQVFFDIVEHH